MKKIYVSILTILILTMSNQKLPSTEPDAFFGDFCVVGALGYNITATMEIVSVPFEGITQLKDTLLIPINRFREIQNGIYWRFFRPGESTIQNNMSFITNTMNANGNILDIGHCSGGEFPLSNDNLSWGFAKYKITISVAGAGINEKYQFYINSLDSKYGRNYTGGYSRDLYVEYISSMPVNKRVVFSQREYVNPKIAIDTIATWDTLANGKPSKEFKLWKVILGQDYPMEKNFYARTTPFPISPRAIYDNHIRELELGTKVIFDTVYNYTGLSDKYGYNTIDSAQRFYAYFTNPPIPSGYDSVKNTFVTPAYFYLDDNSELVMGLKINVLPGDTIILKPDKRLWISGYDQYSDNGDTLVLSAGSVFIKETGAQLNTCRGGTILDYGATMNWSPNAFSHIFQRSELSYLGTSHTINNGGHVEIDGYARLKVGNNTTVTFDGAGTYLKLNPNSIVQLGEKAKIEFKNGAYLVENGGTISSINSSTPGYGINLDDAGAQTEITNCTFTNLINPIRIANNTASTANIFRNINNNTFNMNSFCNYVIETRNVNNISITNNHINMVENHGLGLVMRYPINLQNSVAGISPANFSINIINNEIKNGIISAAILSQTSSIVPITFRENTIDGNASLYNFIGRQLTGNIKNNSFTSVSANCKNIELTSSILNLLNNYFTSPNVNYYNYASYTKLAPIIESSTDAGLVWVGGKNKIYSSGNSNIYFYGGNAELNWGENCFSKISYSTIDYMFGAVNVPTSPYYFMQNNDFNGINYPSTLLFGLVDYNSQSAIIPNFDGSNFTCPNTTDAGTIWQIRDLGNGIMDTIYRTPNTSGIPQTPEQYFYSQSYQENSFGNYYEAILHLKALITDYPNSSYVNAALNDLYINYQALDTSGNQGTRDILNSDLKYYLDNRILSGSYNDEFNYNAYNITLMCLDNMKEYLDAKAGYEFIALYHPEAFIRLMASWDYAEIESILNGSGGISSNEEKMTDNEYLNFVIKRVNASINEDPVKQKVKNSFKNTKKQVEANLEKEIKSKTKDENITKTEISRIKSEESKIDSKTISNIRNAKILKKEEREKRQLEDFIFGKIEKNKNLVNVDNSIPKQYELSQNYPNPFNPMTKINFALPKQGVVTLKIYDITGREIKTLVNEMKQAGNYTVDFNGSSLSSGVYFYKIQSGDFVSVKRMVLIK